MTRRSHDLIARADVILYDRLVSPRTLDHARADADRVYVGKEPGGHTMSQDEINRLLVEHGREGRTVVRLKGGDPFVFGRGAEEAEALAEAGVPF
jgi:siroheme synthase